MTDPDDGDDLDQYAQLDEDDTLEDTGVADPLDRGYSPPDRPWNAEDDESQSARLDREDAGRDPLDEIVEDLDGASDEDVDDETGERLGDTDDTDGELLDDEVGDRRAGRLATDDRGDTEPFAEDEGVDGGGASAEEAAVHVVDEGRR